MKSSAVAHDFRTAAAADMLAWENGGFSIDASVRIGLLDRDVPSSLRSLEHLLRCCGRPAFALERLSSSPGRDGAPERIRSTLPRHKRGRWAGPGRKHKACAPGKKGVVDLEPFEFLDRLTDLVPRPLAPARGPPTSWAELVQVHDDRDAMRTSPDDLPAIDIRSP